MFANNIIAKRQCFVCCIFKPNWKIDIKKEEYQAKKYCEKKKENYWENIVYCELTSGHHCQNGITKKLDYICTDFYLD